MHKARSETAAVGASGPDERGMVTAELAAGTLAVVMVTVLLAWCLHLVTRQLLLEDTAAEVARQAARGDRAAVATARADAPPRTLVTVREEAGAILVRAEQAGGGPGSLPGVVLTAEARVLTEPGASSWPGS